jgi:NADH dehydrogenase/NADH:ubiquinone oxidoreductase subunit G
MNKKLISATAAIAVIAASAGFSSVLADDKNVKVVVNNASVEFEDQQPVIENDRTLIPVRGAFEAMGASVEWDGETRTVTVKSETNTQQAVLQIDSDIMTVYTYKSLLDVEKQEIKLDVAAQIKNDRTMLPLRAVGEALGAAVDWDGDTYTATISTSAVEKSESNKKENKLVKLSLSQAASENEDEIVISVDISGMELYPDSYVSGVTLGLNYDPEVLEMERATLYNGDTEVTNVQGTGNKNFTETRLKTSYITIDEESAAKSDGSVMKVFFKAVKAEPTEVSVSTAYNSRLGYDTSVILGNKSSDSTKFKGLSLDIDATPLKITGAKTVAEATEAPEATATAEATEAPEATATAEATEATETPEATAEPTATPAAK